MTGLRAPLAIIAALAGCDVIFRIDRVDRGDPADAAVTIRDSSVSSSCMFDTPTVLPGFNANAYDPSQRGDKLELYYSINDGSDYDIYVATRSETTVDYQSTTGSVGELSSGNNDKDPALTQNGLRIFLSSTRDGSGYKLFEATRPTVDGVFDTPIVVGLGGNAFNGMDVSPDGRTLYLDDGADTVLEMKRAGDAGDFGASRVVASPAGEFPSVAGDGLSLYYARSGKIYRQTRATPSMAFSGEVEITTGGFPDISEDGHTLIVRVSNGFARLDCGD
jgi:hypothetical protein